MPVIFGMTLLTAAYNAGTNALSVTGKAFADTVYPGISKLEVSSDGALWQATDTIDTWGDEAAAGTFAAPLGAGTYSVRVTSSDGELSNALSDVFTVAESATMQTIRYYKILQYK